MSSPSLPIEVIEHILSFVCGPFSPSSPLDAPAALPRRLVSLPLLLVSHGFTSLLSPYLHLSINIQRQDDWTTFFDPERGTLVAAPQAEQRRSWARELRVADGLAASPPPSVVLPSKIRLPNLTHVCLTHDKNSSERAPNVWDPTASALAEELERPRLRAYRCLLAASPNIDTVSLSISKTWSADLYRFRVAPVVPTGAKIVLHTDPTVSDHDTVRSLLAVHRAGPHEVRLVGFGCEEKEMIVRDMRDRRKEWEMLGRGFDGWAWEDEDKLQSDATRLTAFDMYIGCSSDSPESSAIGSGRA